MLGVDHARADAVVQWRDAENGGTVGLGDNILQSGLDVSTAALSLPKGLLPAPARLAREKEAQGGAR